MNFLLWSGTFLISTIGVSIVELAAMIGLPIAPDVQAGVAAVVVFVIVSGAGIVLFTPRALAPLAL